MFEKGPYEKYIRKHIFFVRHLLVHAMFEKGPYEKYVLFRKFIRLTKHMFFEKVYMFLKKVYMFFEKVCMFFKKYICFLKKYVCFLKKYIFFEKAYIFFVRLLLVHRRGHPNPCSRVGLSCSIFKNTSATCAYPLVSNARKLKRDKRAHACAQGTFSYTPCSRRGLTKNIYVSIYFS